jgi:hypothetical protein
MSDRLNPHQSKMLYRCLVMDDDPKGCYEYFVPTKRTMKPKKDVNFMGERVTTRPPTEEQCQALLEYLPKFRVVEGDETSELAAECVAQLYIWAKQPMPQRYVPYSKAVRQDHAYEVFPTFDFPKQNLEFYRQLQDVLKEQFQVSLWQIRKAAYALFEKKKVKTGARGRPRVAYQRLAAAAAAQPGDTSLSESEEEAEEAGDDELEGGNESEVSESGDVESVVGEAGAAAVEETPEAAAEETAAEETAAEETGDGFLSGMKRKFQWS